MNTKKRVKELEATLAALRAEASHVIATNTEEYVKKIVAAEARVRVHEREGAADKVEMRLLAGLRDAWAAKANGPSGSADVDTLRAYLRFATASVEELEREVAELKKGKDNMNLPDIETVSSLVHEAWMASKRRQGVTTRKSESGEELMVPYDQLSEPAKDLDRNTVQAVYDAIRRAES